MKVLGINPSPHSPLASWWSPGDEGRPCRTSVLGMSLGGWHGFMKLAEVAYSRKKSSCRRERALWSVSNGRMFGMPTERPATSVATVSCNHIEQISRSFTTLAICGGFVYHLAKFWTHFGLFVWHWANVVKENKWPHCQYSNNSESLHKSPQFAAGSLLRDLGRVQF